ncbi:hypothetical protein [Aliivibrio wodanis]|uniref:hypothetical protein n=1 Tax=Aliivibrio wodanis TaxID=80852 RepID=UPI00406C19F1
MSYSAIRFQMSDEVKRLSNNEIDKLVISYHVKDLKSYLKGGETEEGAKCSCNILRQLGMTPFQIAKAAKCKLINLPFV